MQMEDFQTYLLIYYAKSGIDPSNLEVISCSGMTRVFVRHNITVCSNLLSFELPTACLFSDLVLNTILFSNLVFKTIIKTLLFK